MIKSDGTVQCWGDDYYNQVSNTPSGTFTPLLGSYHICGILDVGNVIHWGRNNYKQVSPVPAQKCRSRFSYT